MQSGIHRGAFPDSASAAVDKSKIQKLSKIPGNIYHDMKLMLGEQVTPLNTPTNNESDTKVYVIDNTRGHISEVSGVFIDMMGMVMVSTGLDGLICFWNFQTHALIHIIDIGVPQLLLQGFRDSNFVAVAGQDRVIRMYDIETFHLSRRFSGGHSREITDLAFTPDGRRLLSSSQDSTLRIWDLPTGRCLSWLLFKSPIQSMTVSLSGEYLCIAQAEKQGIQIYIDKSLYETIHFWREPITPTVVEDSSVRMDDTDSNAESMESSTNNKDQDELAISITPSQSHVIVNNESESQHEDINARGVGTITLSSTPKAYWTTLFNLEIIKKRNQPIAAPSPAPKAPFFLPSVIKGGSTPSFPTPLEYAKLTESLKPSSSSSNSNNDINKRVASELSNTQDTSSSKKSKSSVVSMNEVITEDDILDSMAGMSSSWTDNDNEISENELLVSWTIDGGITTSSSSNTTSTTDIINTTTVETHSMIENKRSKSKILNKKIQLPR